MKTIKIYHIFTNNQDEWLTDEKEAIKLFNRWKKEIGTARLYVEIWEANEEETKVNKNCNAPIDENCIKTFGKYPW